MLEKEVATNAAAAAATLSSVMLSFFGVDHQSLFFGFMGAFFTYALRETSGHSRLKSVVFVLASAFIGGVFGRVAPPYTARGFSFERYHNEVRAELEGKK